MDTTGHTGTRKSYFNTLDFLKENVEFSSVNAHILFCYAARSLNIFFLNQKKRIELNKNVFM
jgi:hypothetical protein